MSIESKRKWRLANPERSQAAERERALARRQGFWGTAAVGVALRPCASSESYGRYENKWSLRHLWYRMAGPGAHRMTVAQRRAIINSRYQEKMDALDPDGEVRKLMYG